MAANTISQSEFDNAMNSSQEVRNALAAIYLPVEEVKDVFAFLDQSVDGELDPKEFRCS